MADRDGHLTVTPYVANQGGNNEQRIEENLKQNYDSAWLLHNLKCSPSFYSEEMESRYKEWNGGRKEGKNG